VVKGFPTLAETKRDLLDENSKRDKQDWLLMWVVIESYEEFYQDGSNFKKQGRILSLKKLFFETMPKEAYE
jgi:hypothetical protein